MFNNSTGIKLFRYHFTFFRIVITSVYVNFASVFARLSNFVLFYRGSALIIIAENLLVETHLKIFCE